IARGRGAVTLRFVTNNMMRESASRRWRTALAKNPVAYPPAMALAIRLSCSFHCDSAPPKGCAAPGFATARTFDAGDNPHSVATGDFNGDGNPDLAVANYGGVSVLLGNGEGTFRAPSATARDPFPFRLPLVL